jgi:hypothetical protein
LYADESVAKAAEGKKAKFVKFFTFFTKLLSRTKSAGLQKAEVC